MSLTVVPIHKKPEYMSACCDLINSEWKRSDTARLRSLEGSKDNLPTNLILLKGSTLIGHLKLSPIPSEREACFLESVVIAKDLRGRGYGKLLMRKAEEYCKETLRLNIVFLSTQGQEDFYRKLGYSVCQPISIYGSYVENKRSNAINEIGKEFNKSGGDNLNTPPPPPLPPVTNKVVSKKTYMKKCLK